MTTATIEHTSLTRGYYDYLTINFTPSSTVVVDASFIEM